jgi:hypothetical protein
MYQLGSKCKFKKDRQRKKMYCVHSFQRAKNMSGQCFMELANSSTLTLRNLNTIRFYNLKFGDRQCIVITRSGR